MLRSLLSSALLKTYFVHRISQDKPAKATLCLVQDYWLSLDRYVNWSSTATGKNDFYTDWECRQIYKRHIEHYVNRRNTYNGRLYKEDPTIFYWNLINEPRWCVPSLACNGRSFEPVTE